MASPFSKVKPEDTFSSFSSGESFKSVAQRFGVSANTLRRWWKDHFGEAAFEARHRLNREEALRAFITDEPFKAVARRLHTSPNTLRALWVGHFGQEAFHSRGGAVRSAGAKKYGAVSKGKSKDRTFVDVACETCSVAVRLSLGQKSKLSKVLCYSCQGKTTPCPVCRLLFDSPKGLTHHLWCSKDEEHRLFLSQREEARWRGLVVGRDYVVCQICAFKARSLAGHLKTHGVPASDYLRTYPNALIRSTQLRLERSRKARQFRYDLTPEELLRHADEKGRVIVEAASEAFKCDGSTVRSYCRKYGISTRNLLAWQRVVLDQARKHLGSDYVWEWTDPRITSTDSGRALNFDGYFPEANLIIEVHGEQHFRYSEKWHKSVENFRKQQDRDAHKRQQAEALGFKFKVVRDSDPIFDPDFWGPFLNGDSGFWENTSEEEKSSRVEEILLQLREQGWPPCDPSPQIRAELSCLRDLSVYLDEARHVRPYSVRGSFACSSFFPSRYQAHYKGALSVYDAWHDDASLRKAIRLQLDAGHPTTPQRVRKALVMYHRTPSVFRPALAKYVYQTYGSGGVVWDPCAGFGGRLLGAMSTNVRQYIATDVEPDTVEGNRTLARCLGPEVEARCAIYEQRAEEFDPGVGLDLVFTSPPYYDLETYGASSDSRSYGTVHDWLNRFLRPVIQRAFDSLKARGHLVLNLPFKPVQHVRLDDEARSLAKELGFEELSTIWMPIRTFKGTMKGEPLLIWQKPEK